MNFDVLMWLSVQNYSATSVHFYSAIDSEEQEGTGDVM